MHDLYRHYGNRSLWDKYEIPKCPVVEVTEIWVEEDRVLPAKVETKTLTSTSVESWLEESSRGCSLGGDYTRTARILWVGKDRDTLRVSPSTQVLERLTEAWKLREALDYARCCFAGVSAVESDDGDTQIFTAAYHPKLAAAWSHAASPSDPTPQTHAIIFAEGEERAELHRVLDSQWSTANVGHPMFLALLCSLTLAHGLDKTSEEIKAAVREVEARTGHHRFASRHQTQPAAGELGHLSAQMSGCAAKLANGNRKIQVIKAINDFISQQATQRPRVSKPRKKSEIYIADHSREPPILPAREPFLASQLDLLRHRVEMQAVDTAFVQQRVHIQIAALFHLIAQQDNAIAFDTAKATRSIAASSLQDSSSMKMLALVAMFFLPGSFVAALFSTPLFAWDEALARGGMGVGTRPQFLLFVAVVVPLTAFIFLLYGLWMCAQGRRERGKDHHAMTLGVV